MYRKFVKATTILLLTAMPLIVIGLWALWYRTTFDAYDSRSSNYTALAGLYGKSNICKDKDSLLGQYALTCTSIYSFCNTDPPNITPNAERDDAYEVDKTEDCNIYMNATKPFRYLFIPSIISSLVAFGVGITLIIKALLHFIVRRQTVEKKPI